jgi:hypothetical protein
MLPASGDLTVSVEQTGIELKLGTDVEISQNSSAAVEPEVWS